MLMFIVCRVCVCACLKKKKPKRKDFMPCLKQWNASILYTLNVESMIMASQLWPYIHCRIAANSWFSLYIEQCTLATLKAIIMDDNSKVQNGFDKDKWPRTSFAYQIAFNWLDFFSKKSNCCKN